MAVPVTVRFKEPRRARGRLQSQSIGRGEALLVIEDVPVIHCPNCGESYLTAETLKEIEVIRLDRQAARKRPVSVAQFAMKQA